MKDLTTVNVATMLIFLLARSVSTATTEKWFCTDKGENTIRAISDTDRIADP